MGDYNTGEFLYEINGECLLSIQLKELDQNHELFQEELMWNLTQAIETAYRQGCKDMKTNIQKAIERI